MNVPGEPVAIDFLDMDGDNNDEVVTANANPVQQGAGSAYPVLTLFRGQTGGGFGGAVPIAPLGASSGLDVSLIDADNDGDRDIVSVHPTSQADSEAVLIRIDTVESGDWLSIVDQKILPALAPVLCTRGDLDRVEGEDVFLVNQGQSSLVDGGTTPTTAIPYRAVKSGDVNGDGLVNATDLALLLSAWGANNADADFNGDGIVNGADMAVLFGAWSESVALTVQSVTPSSGPLVGGTSVTITGSGFVGVTDVLFGDASCTNVQVVNNTTVTAVTPAGSAGAHDVVVKTSAGTAALASGFTYATVVVPPWATLLEAAPDPAVVTDATLRAAITATGLAWRVKDTATQIEMMLIPPGTFNMGCSASQSYGCSSNENPVHQVTLTNAFYLGRYEVTQAQWQARMGNNPSYFQSASTEVPLAQVPQRPVERVSWTTIQGFLTNTSMRLPTEAEWEYACRAGTTTAFHGYTGQLSGTNADSLLGNIAWFGSNSNGQTRPVGGKRGNGFGLYDMSGNVWEWVNDWYGNYSAGAQTNPQGPLSGSNRVLRGGCWLDNSVNCRASTRSFSVPGNGSSVVIGFRVARTP